MVGGHLRDEAEMAMVSYEWGCDGASVRSACGGIGHLFQVWFLNWFEYRYQVK